MLDTIKLPVFNDKDVIFVGKGKEGVSFKKFIEKYGKIKSFRFVDQKDGPDYLENLKSIDQRSAIIVKTPGLPGNIMPVAYTTPTRVFFDCIKQLGIKSVGVTGTKGKTTTSSLLAATLSDAGVATVLCGNSGHPMLDALAEAKQDTTFVVELSSYQLAELQQSPDIAIITNLFNDHTQYHGSLDAYWESKRNIIKYMPASGNVIYDPNTEMVLHWLAESPVQKTEVNAAESVDMSAVKLIGNHNKLNYLMVRAAARLFNISDDKIYKSFQDFEPVRHRLQTVKTARGITYVDDAIGSTPEATIAGIEALIQNRGPVGCVMLGGDDRNYDFSKLTALLHRVGVPKLVLFPDTGRLIKDAFPGGYTPEIHDSTSIKDAVLWASENTPSGSICLLSTAAPSHVLWSSFEEKGSLFQEAVLALPN